MKKQTLLAVLFILFALPQVYAQKQNANASKDKIKIVKNNRQQKDKIIYIIDGDTLSESSFKTLDPSIVESISVVKSADKSKSHVVSTVIITTRLEYSAVVNEPGFESFLAVQQSKDFFSINTLKTRNAFMVNEWNFRCKNPEKYSSEVYDKVINYDPKVNYGLDVEYMLYMFFRYMDKKYGWGVE